MLLIMQILISLMLLSLHCFGICLILIHMKRLKVSVVTVRQKAEIISDDIESML